MHFVSSICVGTAIGIIHALSSQLNREFDLRKFIVDVEVDLGIHLVVDLCVHMIIASL